jgi:hypothetical protein
MSPIRHDIKGAEHVPIARTHRRRTRFLAALAALCLTAAVSPTVAAAKGGPGPNAARGSFVRIAHLPVFENGDDLEDVTVAEIIDASEDGTTLAYTDAARQVLGFVDITDPAAPIADGTVALDGEPTSVVAFGAYALAMVDTSESFTNPSGYLAIVDMDTHGIVHTIALGGQPDSAKVSPDGAYLAIAIENERDEEVADGELPQLPAGLLQIVDLTGDPTAWTVRDVDLTGLAGYAPDDPEPEFVDVDDRNRAVVTLQENNHIVIVDLPTGAVVDHFSAGTVTADGVDATEDGVVSLTDTITDVPREPDAVTWLPGSRLATANEGDLFGGSRGFTVFEESGAVAWDSGASFEDLAVRHGHYPEDRSENKGSEPEGIASGRYGGADLLFVGSERGSFVATYALDVAGMPSFRQFLPTGLGPEGILPIPDRDLLVVTSEEDDPPYGVRAVISIYAYEKGAPTYPDIVSADDDTGTAIGWGALSALASDPKRPKTLYAISDSFYSASRIFTLDVSKTPAVITRATTISGADDLDAEGLQLAPDGTFWVASEGNASDSRENRLLQVAADGTVLQEVGLPAEIVACRAASANRGTLGSGFEGVAIVPTGRHTYTLAVAQQRGWDYTTAECEGLDDDPAGTNPAEPAFTRIWTYEPTSETWGHIAYELEPKPEIASWVGLSEITQSPAGLFALIERDNRTGSFSSIKNVVWVDLEAQPDGVITRDEKHSVDILPALRATNGWITDKPEGLTFGADRQVYVVTDNDGVDGWSGDTQLLRLGHAWDVFTRSMRR